MQRYIIYFNDAGHNKRAWFSDTQKIKTIHEIRDNIKHFEMFKGYDASDEGLNSFVSDFHKWNEQLKTCKVFKDGINWLDYPCNAFAVQNTFKRVAGKLIKNHDIIDRIEAQYIEACNNGGLMYCRRGFIGMCYGYDYKGYYQNLLASEELLIPTKRGQEYNLEELPKRKELKVGYYRVKITCDNEDFKKIFAFSSQNTYTHYSVKFAMKRKKLYKISIELIKDDKPNAYLYSDEDLVSGASIFGEWNKRIMTLKKVFPNNKLVKHLGTSLWGHLIKKNTIKRTDKEIEDEKLDVGFKSHHDYILINTIINDKNEYNELQNSKEPYKYNIRIKALMTSLGRYKIAEVAETYLDEVIRIQTDGIVFSNNPDKKLMEDLNFFPEDKTTGNIEWTHVNKYQKIE